MYPHISQTWGCGTAESRGLGRVSAAELGAARRVLDVEGHTVMPGFVDIHTHYDAQLHFEPTASPASWHGVTTVVTGNCGFTIAPARDGDAAWLLEMLSRVEGMSAPALREGCAVSRRHLR